MVKMGRKSKRRKTNKWALILVSIVGIVTIVAIAVLFQNQLGQPKPTTEEYFEISDVTYDGFENGSLLIVNILEFNLTAVGGDAHYVIIQNLGPDEPSASRPDYVELGTMLKGEVRSVRLSTEYGVYVHLSEEGFPIKVRVTSEETSQDPKDQFITVYL